MKDSNKIIGYLTLITGLLISTVAIYYSVSGLVNIFSAAAISVIIMGVALEIGKLAATVWLKQNWNSSPILLKLYLIVAVIILMIITSMGIYGFLSKAHLDQLTPASVINDKISFINDRIKLVEENINDYKNSISQLDRAASQAVALSSTDKGTIKAIAARKSQSAERSQLQNGIASSQLELEKLRAEKEPLVESLRHIEAEVGPIKYIAAALSSSTNNIDLESAVRIVILLIVSIFDPLAVSLLLASQHCFSKINIADTATNNTVLPTLKKPPVARKPRVKKVVSVKNTIDEVEKADLSELNEMPISAVADMPISENVKISDDIISNEIPSELDAAERPGDYIIK